VGWGRCDDGNAPESPSSWDHDHADACTVFRVDLREGVSSLPHHTTKIPEKRNLANLPWIGWTSAPFGQAIDLEVD
jgi:hypothetical protein